MTRLDTDEIATLVRIYGTPAEQAQLLRQTRIIRGQLCPECGAEEAESNGCAGSDEEFRCCTCDHRWAPIDISLELPAAAPVDDADFDLEAMFPVPPTTSRRSLDARVAHTTNKRGW